MPFQPANHPVDTADFQSIEKAVAQWPEPWPDAWRERMAILAEDTKRYALVSAYRQAYKLVMVEAERAGVTLPDPIAREAEHRGYRLPWKS